MSVHSRVGRDMASSLIPAGNLGGISIAPPTILSLLLTERRRGPFSTVIGKGRVIKGWDEGACYSTLLARFYD